MAEKVMFRKGIYTNRRIIEVDGEAFIQDEDTKSNLKSKNKAEVQVNFTKVNLVEYDKMVEEAAEKLSSKANVKQILVQSLRDLSLTDLKKVSEELNKEEPKIRNEKGCVVLRVGKTKITLRD